MVQNKRTLAQETRGMLPEVANVYAGLRFMALNEKPGSPDAIRATALFKGLRVAVVESNKTALEERMAAARILLEGYFGPKNEVPRGI